MSSEPSAAKLRQRSLLGGVVLLLALLLAAMLWFRGRPGNAEAALRRASLSELQAATERNPEDARAWYYRGLRLQQAGQNDAARAAFERAASLGDSEDIYLGWATASPDAQAITILTSFLARHPDSGAAHLALAHLFQQTDDQPHSYEQAALAAKQDSKNPLAWQIYGDTALAMNNFPEAAEAYRHAVALNPQSARSRIGLGAALMQTHQRDESLAAFQEAIRLAPQDGTPRIAYGKILLQNPVSSADIETARQNLLEGLRLSPDSAPGYLYLGQCLIRQGKWQDALTALKKAQTTLPDEPDTSFALAQAYRGLGDARKAESATRRHSALEAYHLERDRLLAEPSANVDPQLHLKLARLAARHAANTTAVAEYQTALAQSPGDATISRELAAIQRLKPDLP